MLQNKSDLDIINEFHRDTSLKENFRAAVQILQVCMTINAYALISTS